MIPEQNIESRLAQIIADTLKRRESGESVRDEDVLAAHPDLADQLGQKLQQMALLANARELANTHASEATISMVVEAAESNSSKLSKDLRPGQKLRHYLLEEQIGVGGFGSVWRARDSKLDCEVAIKVPRRELSPEDTERFIQEARVAAQLRKHPNIVSVHEADWQDSTAFIVSDYVDGDSLDDRLDRSRMPHDEAVELIILVCQALQHAHETGIIHRDLKPENILLDDSGIPHVTDFGLAMRANELTNIVPGRITGTAAYMSPEQAKGESDSADCRSDIFSLGIVLFELLTGERPYRGSVPLIMRQIVGDEPPRPRSFDPRIPADLETICLKCVEKDPSHRYQSAIELSNDLRRFVRREPIQARPITTAGRLLRWSQRNPSIPLLSLSLMIVTIAASWASFRLLKTEVSDMQDRLNGQAERNLEFLSVLAADDAELYLASRFEQVSNMVEDLHGNQDAIQQLTNWNATDAQDQAETGTDYQRSWNAPPEELAKVQESLELQAQLAGVSTRTRTYSFFVCDRHGFQIARWPATDTLGKSFGYRSYFTGRDADDLPGNAMNPVWRAPDSEPRLSDSFLTVRQDAWVIAVSAPIWFDGEFQGVTGVFIELGNLIGDPGSLSSNEARRSMSVFDTRQGPENARRIHYHPFTTALNKVTAGDLGNIKPNFPLQNEGSTGCIYVDQWRIAIHPIELSHYYDGRLFVLMQEQAKSIEDPGNKLLKNLILMGWCVVAFAAIVLTSIWVIILQRIVKT